jgi:hypothetical protein
MALDLQNAFRKLIDYGSESYETRITRTALKIGAIALFVLVVWKLLK